jgi:hypothetical protein
MTSSRFKAAAIAPRDAAFDEVQRQADTVEPRATAVRYLPDRNAILIELSKGCDVVVPVALLPIEIPDGADLSVGFGDPQIYGGGEYVFWEAFEDGISVPGIILKTLFGRDAWRAWSTGWSQKVDEAEARIRHELASKAGATKSPAKAAAARANGKKGGRPKKRPA